MFVLSHAREPEASDIVMCVLIDIFNLATNCGTCLFSNTGYIVFSGCRRSNGVQGLRVIVQSDRDPQYVEDRVEAFLLKMEVIILIELLISSFRVDVSLFSCHLSGIPQWYVRVMSNLLYCEILAPWKYYPDFLK